MKKILKNMYLVSAGLFFVLSVLGFLLGKSINALIAGIIMSLFSVLFNFLFKPTWSEETRDILKDCSEKLKPLGDKLPLGVIGKLSIVFIILMVISSLEPIVVMIINTFPTFIFTLLYNISFGMFVLGLFFNMFQGNLDSISKMSKIFAFYNIFDILLTFIFESFKVNTKGMVLFLVFYSIAYVLDYMMRETDPTLEVEEEKVKEKKTKKDKNKKNKKDEETEDDDTDMIKEALEGTTSVTSSEISTE